MKVLVLGGEGMLGHKAYQVLSTDFDVFVTFLDYNPKLLRTGIFKRKAVIDTIDAFNFGSVIKVIERVKPDYVFNCIGIIKQLKDSSNPRISIYINSLFPHLLAEHGSKTGFKLIQISTDCVFSGKKGDYKETDHPDADDLYGRTKYLGEIIYSNHLTLRTSIIGRELFTSVSFVDWFLQQKDKTVNGYVNAIYTGLTTIAFCNEVKRIIRNFSDLSGLYQVSSEKINKFDLLNVIKKIYGLKCEIAKYQEFHCDRSLDSSNYRKATGFVPNSWENMVQEMYLDKTPYHKWR